VRELIPQAIRSLPWSMLFAVCMLMAMSLLTLYSAAGGSLAPWASNQGARFVVLFAFMLTLSLVPVRVWRERAFLIYGIVLILLLAVEVFGKIGMGAQRWIDLGIVRLQPSELMKIAIVLALAAYFDRIPPVYLRSPRTLLIPAALIAMPVALVMLQPDLGTSMMIALASVTVLFLAGVPLRWFIGGALAIAALVPLAVNYLLHDYQRNRVLTFLDPASDPLGTGYHINQSQIAIGSGGVFGKGFLQGTQSHLNYLPETHTDFIFATLMEEWGLLGGLLVLIVYGTIIAWANGVASRSRSRFSRLCASGLSVTIFLYVSINIAMVIGLAPVVGIPLPLLSYGGSAMMTVLMLLGILMSIDRAERQPAMTSSVYSIPGFK
jgi:rod shape determining protein RodA